MEVLLNTVTEHAWKTNHPHLDKEQFLNGIYHICFRNCSRYPNWEPPNGAWKNPQCKTVTGVSLDGQWTWFSAEE